MGLISLKLSELITNDKASIISSPNLPIKEKQEPKNKDAIINKDNITHII